MKVQEAGLQGLKRIELDVYTDERGYFLESHQAERYAQALGCELRFVQDNCSHSRRGVLRGLHYQVGHPQGKLLRVVQGAIFDVAVDLRRNSATFGRWEATVLAAPGFQVGELPAVPDTADADAVDANAADVDAASAGDTRSCKWGAAVGAGTDVGAGRGTDKHIQLWVPPGFAHGFYVLSDSATVEYKCTGYYRPDDEACLRWDDPDVAIDWPGADPILSAKDRQGASLADLLRAGRMPVERAGWPARDLPA